MGYCKGRHGDVKLWLTTTEKQMSADNGILSVNFAQCCWVCHLAQHPPVVPIWHSYLNAVHGHLYEITQELNWYYMYVLMYVVIKGSTVVSHAIQALLIKWWKLHFQLEIGIILSCHRELLCMVKWQRQGTHSGIHSHLELEGSRLAGKSPMERKVKIFTASQSALIILGNCSQETWGTVTELLVLQLLQALRWNGQIISYFGTWPWFCKCV
jgi:hypothetical protein